MGLLMCSRVLQCTTTTCRVKCLLDSDFVLLLYQSLEHQWKHMDRIFCFVSWNDSSSDVWKDFHLCHFFYYHSLGIFKILGISIAPFQYIKGNWKKHFKVSRDNLLPLALSHFEWENELWPNRSNGFKHFSLRGMRIDFEPFRRTSYGRMYWVLIFDEMLQPI